MISISQIKEVKNKIIAELKDVQFCYASLIADTLTYIHFVYKEDPLQFIDLAINLKNDKNIPFFTFEKLLYHVMKSKVNTQKLKISSIVREIPELYSDSVLASSIHLYLLKGHFLWHNEEDSSFYKLIQNKNNLDEQTGINCYEAIMYGLIKGKFVNKNDVINKKDNYFDFNLSHPLDKEWENISKQNIFMIFVDDGYGQGKHHRMLSVPFDEPYLLSILINKNIHIEKNIENGITFSLWINLEKREEVILGRIGTMPSSDVVEYMESFNKITNMRIHILQIN